MKKPSLTVLSLGLAVVGFALGMGGVVSYFNNESGFLLLMVIGWLLLLGGGLSLLIPALKDYKKEVKSKKMG
jgi:hypothetical protein